MYNDLYNEMIVVLTLLLLIYALTIPLILNTDDKIKHVKWSALGLKNVLKSCEQKDIESILRVYQKKRNCYTMNICKKNQVQKNIFQMLLYGWILLF